MLRNVHLVILLVAVSLSAGAQESPSVASIPAKHVDVSECLQDAPRPDECRILFTGVVTITSDAVSCPSTPILNGVTTAGSINQNTDCRVVVPTAFGPVNTYADVFSLQTLGGSTLRATLDSGNDLFGFPYLAVMNAAGEIVAARVGTQSMGSGFRASLEYIVPTAGTWLVLVTGVGGRYGAAGPYQLTVSFAEVRKRRAVRQ
jgi:hypothetical protein